MLDDRRNVRPYIDIDFIQCPFSALSGDQLDQATTDYVLSSYELWFGARIVAADAATEMGRIGDRPLYNGNRFNILLADYERNWNGDSGRYNYTASHPDKSGLLNLLRPLSPQYTGQYFGNRANNTRGPLDRQFLRDDGSCFTLKNLSIGDYRLVRLPFSPAGNNPNAYSYLPPLD